MEKFVKQKRGASLGETNADMRITRRKQREHLRKQAGSAVGGKPQMDLPAFFGADFLQTSGQDIFGTLLVFYILKIQFSGVGEPQRR